MEHMDKGLEVIKSLLQNQEEAYREGSWESFSKQKPTKNKRLGWFWGSGIAASILLIGIVFLWSDNPESKLTQLAGVKMNAKQKEITEKAPLIKPHKINQPTTQIKQKPLGKSIITSAVIRQNIPEPKPENTVIAQTILEQEKTDTNHPNKNKNISQYSTYPPNETNNNKYSKKNNRWMLGMAMASDFSNSKKMGIGLEAIVGYALNPNITIMFGAGYREIYGFKENDSQTLSASDEKRLESATVQLTGVELPLALRYNVNKRLYAKIGISAFATIKQSGELTYRRSVTHIESFVGPNGEVNDKTVISEVRSVVNLKEHQDKDNYNSFINISFGYRYPLLKNKTITLEPFIRFPMQSSKIENVKFSSAGLRLGIDI